MEPETTTSNITQYLQSLWILSTSTIYGIPVVTKMDLSTY